jgi:hypothetical protein
MVPHQNFFGGASRLNNQSDRDVHFRDRKGTIGAPRLNNQSDRVFILGIERGP